MSVINDSSAIVDGNRILTQHQAALTLLQSKLQNPSISVLSWLDLACGKGQIVSQLEDNISQSLRSKISYCGYDVKIDYTRIAEKKVESCELNEFKFKHGELSDYPTLIDNSETFDFITFTNTAHEISPTSFSVIIYESILRLTDEGELFIYDMESLTSPELGALPWTVEEIKDLISTLLKEMGSSFEAHPNSWQHSQVKGWTLTIPKKYLGVSDDTLNDVKDKVINAVNTKIKEIIEKRFIRCQKLLTSLCKYGSETGSEENEKVSALYEFWALYQAMEATK